MGRRRCMGQPRATTRRCTGSAPSCRHVHVHGHGHGHGMHAPCTHSLHCAGGAAQAGRARRGVAHTDATCDRARARAAAGAPCGRRGGHAAAGVALALILALGPPPPSFTQLPAPTHDPAAASTRPRLYGHPPRPQSPSRSCTSWATAPRSSWARRSSAVATLPSGTPPKWASRSGAPSGWPPTRRAEPLSPLLRSGGLPAPVWLPACLPAYRLTAASSCSVVSNRRAAARHWSHVGTNGVNAGRIAAPGRPGRPPVPRRIFERRVEPRHEWQQRRMYSHALSVPPTQCT